MIGIDNISYSIGKKKVLDDISCTFNDGEIIGIIGPSGSGKTMLLKALSGEVHGLRGQIHITDPRTVENDKKKLPAVTRIHNHIPLNRDDTLFNFLLSARMAYKKRLRPFSDYDRQTVNEYIELLNLKQYSDNKINTLTDGIMKKSIIAFGFIRDSHALLLDNPTEMLDLASLHIMPRVMTRFVMNGARLIVLGSNDLNFVLQTADRIMIMLRGSIVREIKPDEVTAEIIKQYFNTDVILSRNIYNGKPEIHYFPQK